MTTPTDSEIAREAARTAADLLVRIRAEHPHLDARALGDLGDRRAQELIAARLAESAPGDAVLSEEAPDDQARLGAERVWIVDPLDGTREYGEGRDDWAVHVALVVGGALAVGAVALAGPDDVLVSSEPHVSDDEPADPLRIAVSRSRPPAIARDVAGALGAELVPLGSAGAKICAVVRGEVDAYVHAGGQYEWDSAAPVAVARAAGLHTSRLDGSDLVYNRPDPYVPDLVVCRPEIAHRLLGSIATA